ncbi:hypothetical protein J7M02_03380 [Candidatus Aerophobetes bacterium]|nr:hypothetical protein [Candidatus Aerophobetes bacterium]
MAKRKPKNRLSKITITTVGIVDNPAIEREFLIWKRQEVNDMDDVNKRATEAEKKAQQARAKKYGIGIKADGNVTKPKEYSNVPESEFADPVNFRYPIDKAHIYPAIRYFAKPYNRKDYSREEQKIIWTRIMRAAKKFGIKHRVWVEDLDPLLPDDLKAWAKGEAKVSKKEVDDVTEEERKVLEEENEKLKKKLEELEAKVGEVDAKLKEKEDALKKVKEEKQNLEKEKVELEKRELTLDEILKSLEKFDDDARKKLKDALVGEKEDEEVSKKLDDISKASETLANKVAEMEKAFKDLKTYVDDNLPVRKGLGADADEDRDDVASKVEKIRKSKEYQEASLQDKIKMAIDPDAYLKE